MSPMPELARLFSWKKHVSPTYAQQWLIIHSFFHSFRIRRKKLHRAKKMRYREKYLNKIVGLKKSIQGASKITSHYVNAYDNEVVDEILNYLSGFFYWWVSVHTTTKFSNSSTTKNNRREK